MLAQENDWEVGLIWLDLACLDLTWLHLTFLGLTWLDVIWLDFRLDSTWLDLTSLDFTSPLFTWFHFAFAVIRPFAMQPMCRMTVYCSHSLCTDNMLNQQLHLWLKTCPQGGAETCTSTYVLSAKHNRNKLGSVGSQPIISRWESHWWQHFGFRSRWMLAKDVSQVQSPGNCPEG